MIINKKFRDYYDTAMDYVDKTCVYNRFPKNLDNQSFYEALTILGYKENTHFTEGPLIISNIHGPNCTPYIIGFCGKLYAAYRIERPGSDTFCYDAASCIESMGDTLASRDYAIRIQEFFNRFNGKEHTELFIKHSTPIFVIEYSSIKYFGWSKKDYFMEINSCLSAYAFYKKFRAEHAFQEIQMFLQGTLAPGEKETVVIEDKYRIAARGFDKWSFRNPDPPKRKQK